MTPFPTCRAVQFALLLTFLLAPLTAFAQGNYAEVTKADVLKMKLHHYFTADNRPHEADFEWTFKENAFVIRKAKGAVPQELVRRFVPDADAADEIHGKWTLDNGQLAFSEVRSGEKKGRDLSLRVYRTAPTVIRLGEPQYVFAVQ